MKYNKGYMDSCVRWNDAGVINLGSCQVTILFSQNQDPTEREITEICRVSHSLSLILNADLVYWVVRIYQSEVY
ncbi:MAG: hypothetical protein V3V99_02395 [candidate division Zixibacteria bacterium]